MINKIQSKNVVRDFGYVKGINLGISLLINKNNVHILKTENYLITVVHVCVHTDSCIYGINISVEYYRVIGLCMYIIFTSMLLKYFSTNSVAMMKYLAGVMALGIYIIGVAAISVV